MFDIILHSVSSLLHEHLQVDECCHYKAFSLPFVAKHAGMVQTSSLNSILPIKQRQLGITKLHQQIGHIPASSYSIADPALFDS